MWGWIIAGTVAVIALISFYQYQSQRGTYRALSSRQPERRVSKDIPLGMEAIDLDAVKATTRRNESLERSQTSWSRKGGLLSGAADTDIQPLSDDETYAKRFHTVFMNNKPKDRI